MGVHTDSKSNRDQCGHLTCNWLWDDMINVWNTSIVSEMNIMLDRNILYI